MHQGLWLSLANWRFSLKGFMTLTHHVLFFTLKDAQTLHNNVFYIKKNVHQSQTKTTTVQPLQSITQLRGLMTTFSGNCCLQYLSQRVVSNECKQHVIDVAHLLLPAVLPCIGLGWWPYCSWLMLAISSHWKRPWGVSLQGDIRAYQPVTDITLHEITQKSSVGRHEKAVW